jgi:hypothetical protein
MWNKPQSIVKTLKTKKKQWKRIKKFITHSMNKLEVTWYKLFMLGFFLVDDKKDVNVKCM